ncbi:hypothetical protein [Myxococcus vastator]|uniref:hypothetical protein n=1 Tax=Myxococcus vastator TaxID=2709664 RepID=UPI0013D6A342|nr:hypothetical protein [Myxococcus vastator]
MKRTAISLMLAFSTMTGLAACGPDATIDQPASPEAPTVEGNVTAMACPLPDGYYYCPSVPEVRYYFFSPTCPDTEPENTAPFQRADCVAACDTDCVHVSTP